MGDERRYLLGPLESRGLIAGWRAGQILSVAIGCALGALAASISTAPPMIVVALVLVGAGVAGALFPLRGRTFEEWAPVLVAFALRRRARPLAAVECIDASSVGGPSGVGALRLNKGTITVSMELAGSGIALLDPEARTRRVDGLIAALAALSREGSSVDRVSWVSSTLHDHGQRIEQDLRRRADLEPHGAVASYRALVGEVAPRGCTRQVLLSLRSSIDPHAPGASAGFFEEVGQVARSIEEAGHRPVQLLGAEQLEERLSRMSPIELARRDDAVRLVLVPTERFSVIELDESVAAAWWVAGWPAQPVTAELLAPLLLEGEGRLLSVVFEPVAPSVAMRRAKNAKTSDAADAEIRRRGGFLVDRRREREAAHVLEREAELVDGHGSLRFAGYLVVMAEDRETLEQRAAEVELAAAQVRITLRRLQGEHARGLHAVLPLCGGLP